MPSASSRSMTRRSGPAVIASMRDPAGRSIGGAAYSTRDTGSEGLCETRVVIAADSRAPNGAVVQAMLRARDAGAAHFLFAIRRE